MVGGSPHRALPTGVAHDQEPRRLVGAAGNLGRAQAVRGSGEISDLCQNKNLKLVEQVRIWMKSIYELLLESEQLRLETDDAGPQVTIDNYLVKLNFDENYV